MFGARVPEEDLARVGASEDEIRVERGKGNGKDVGLYKRQKQASSQRSPLKVPWEKGEAYLRVEDEFWPIEQVEVPDANQAVRIRHGGRILVVRSNAEFWELYRSRAKREIQSAPAIPRAGRRSGAGGTDFWRPIETGHGTILRPAVILERTHKLNISSFVVVTSKRAPHENLVRKPGGRPEVEAEGRELTGRRPRRACSP